MNNSWKYLLGSLLVVFTFSAPLSVFGQATTGGTTGTNQTNTIATTIANTAANAANTALTIASPGTAVLGWALGTSCGLTDFVCNLQGGMFQIVSWASYIIAYVLLSLSNGIIVLEAFILQFILDYNMEIMESPAVRIGFSVTLAFANLLFVATIIAMAVATIVRYTPYGYKALLRNVIIAAIGVNFSLILAGTVLNFSNDVTKFLIRQTMPDNAEGFHQFTKTLVGAFQPQRQLFTELDLASSTTSGGGNVGANFVKSFQSKNGQIFAMLGGIFISMYMQLAIVIFLAVLIAALAYRYILMGLLLAVLPVVWLVGIFPFGQSLRAKWIDYFFRWTFFAPVAFFFMYLALQMADVLNKTLTITNKADPKQLIDPSGNNSFPAVYEFFGAFAGPLVSSVINSILVGGSLYYGLVFARNWGIKFTGAGANAMQSVLQTAKRRSVDYAAMRSRRTFDAIRTGGKDKDGNSKLQQIGSRWVANAEKSTALRMLGVGAIGRQVANLGVQNKKVAEAEVARYRDQYKNVGAQALVERLHRYSSGSLAMRNYDDMTALMEELASRKGGAALITGKDTPFKNEGDLKTLMEVAANVGKTKDLTKGNAKLKLHAIPVSQKKRGDDVVRSFTEAEAYASAVRDLDEDAVKVMSPKEFGPELNDDGDFVNEKDITPEQIHTVLNLKANQVNTLSRDNPEAALRYARMMRYIFEKKTEHDAGRQHAIFRKIAEGNDLNANKDAKKFSDYKDALGQDAFGVTDELIQQALPAIRSSQKNIREDAIIEEFLESRKKKKNNTSSTTGGTTGTGTTSSFTTL